MTSKSKRKEGVLTVKDFPLLKGLDTETQTIILSQFNESQQKLLRDIQKLLNQKLPMYTVEGFEPTNDMQPIKKSKKKKKFRKRFKK